MGVYQDSRTHRWRYDFMRKGRRYTRKGFGGADAARNAESAHRTRLMTAQPEFITAGLRARAETKRATEINERLTDFLPAAAEYRVDQARAGFVYVVNAETGLTKIGKARQPMKRFWTLKCHSPAELWLLATIPTNDASALERWFHKDLHKYRVRGEWFRLPGRTLEWLCRIAGVVMTPDNRMIELSNAAIRAAA